MSDTRTRRSSGEVRQLAIAAARAVFGELGYDATSTRAISERAGISESMLFRHFGTKAALYDEAVLMPFAEFTETFVSGWISRNPADTEPEQLAISFIREFFGMCRQNLELVTALNGTPSTQRCLDLLTGQMHTFHDQIEFVPPADPEVTVRLAIALVVGVAQLGDQFLGMVPDTLISELAAFVVRGSGYPGTGYPSGGPHRTPAEAIDAYFAAVRGADVDTLHELFAAKVEFIVGGVTLSSGDEVADFYRKTLGERSPQPQPGPPVITGNRAAVEIELHMEGQIYRVADFFAFDRTGRITRLIAYPLM